MKTTAILKYLYAFTTISLFTSVCFGQTNIGGVINTYARVSSTSSSCSCPSTNCATATVVSAAGFAANDLVLIIQMKGAKADTSNTASHGDILNLNDAGNYELDTIASIAGNVITFTTPLKQTYFTNSSPADSAYVQLIKVPVYSGNVNVTSTLTPQAWNPVTGTGGVLAFIVSGTLTLQANISADGAGFRAAKKQQVTVSCGNDTNFYYQSTIWNYSSCTSCGYVYNDSPTRLVDVATYGGCGSPCATNRMNSQDNRLAAYRGEGIVANTFKKTFNNGNVAIFDKGKAKWGNGGGGGGNHNAGGGGGGNYGVGGFGGNAYNVSGAGGCAAGTHSKRRGYGGVSLTPNGSRIFMGGGGGEGHDNGTQGSTGTNGGGIIIIKATNITNSGSYTISANGTDNTFDATSDGSGGGGAGGTILLDVSGSYTSAVTISAKGGFGGDNSQSNCHGPGGGGGGGVIWFSTGSGGSVPANVTPVVSGGANGTNFNPSFDCGTASWGATSGASGAALIGLASGATVFLNMNDCSTPLPVEMVSFRADVVDDKVVLNWTMASERNNDYFTVERSDDGITFSDLSRVDGAGNSTTTRTYSSVDEHPLFGVSYYRIRQTNYDGQTKYSQIVILTIDKAVQLEVFPNPAENYFTVSFEGVKNFNVQMVSASEGNFYESKNITGQARIDVSGFPKGIYFLKAYTGKTMKVKKLIIM